MKPSRFRVDQIIGLLKKHEAGITVTDLCRKHGVHESRGYSDALEGLAIKTDEDSLERLSLFSKVKIAPLDYAVEDAEDMVVRYAKLYNCNCHIERSDAHLGGLAARRGI